MAKTRTDKCSYPSLYSPNGWVTGLQYILELVCENKAKKDNIDLPIKFWNIDIWIDYYKSQLRVCSQLIKRFNEPAIINMLKNNDRIYSLRPAWVKTLIAIEHAKLEAKRKKPREQPIDSGVVLDSAIFLRWSALYFRPPPPRQFHRCHV